MTLVTVFWRVRECENGRKAYEKILCRLWFDGKAELDSFIARHAPVQPTGGELAFRKFNTVRWPDYEVIA